MCRQLSAVYNIEMQEILWLESGNLKSKLYFILERIERHANCVGFIVNKIRGSSLNS